LYCCCHGAGCLPVTLPQSAKPRAYLQIAVDWNALSLRKDSPHKQITPKSFRRSILHCREFSQKEGKKKGHPKVARSNDCEGWSRTSFHRCAADWVTRALWLLIQNIHRKTIPSSPLSFITMGIALPRQGSVPGLTGMSSHTQSDFRCVEINSPTNTGRA
jgi:hypothetical protein